MKAKFRKFLSFLLSLLIGIPVWLFGQGVMIASAAVPTVTPDDIGPTVVASPGNGGVFIIGTKLIGEFNDSANAPVATAVDMDFSEFGGGIVSANESAPGSRIWQALYTIVEGPVISSTADIKVTVTNADGTIGPVEDNENNSVDTTRPALDSAETVSTTRIVLDFSEPILSASVSPSDFIISSPDILVASVAVDGSDASKINLTTNATFNGGDTPTIRVSDVSDLAGNVIVPNSQIVASDTVNPQVGFGVQNLTYTEGKNDRQDNLTVGFTENILAIGSPSDYSVIYDSDGDFATTGDQRNIQVDAVSNDENDTTVSLTIADQSGNTDVGGKFRIDVNPLNVKDAAGNTLDASANSTISDFIRVFDSSAPRIDSFGLDPADVTVGVGGKVIVFLQTDDSSCDQYLQTKSGSLNSHPLTFAYNVAKNRYEAEYQVSPGDDSVTDAEALNVSLIDRAGNLSNVVSTYGDSLTIDTSYPDAPIIVDPSLPEIVNADAMVISGTAEFDSMVKVYSDPDGDGDKSDGIELGGVVATNGKFMLSVGLMQNSDNYFVVTATDAGGNESLPAIVPVITEDSSAPSLPTQFAVKQDGDYVTLSWNASEGADHYEIWRSASPYKLIATVSGTTLFYTDRAVESGTQYHYKVVAVDMAGNRTESAELSITLSEDEASTASSDEGGSDDIVTASFEEAVDGIEVSSYGSPNVATNDVSVSPEMSSSPEVRGAETQAGEGEAWWPLLFPIAFVLLIGAIVPLNASLAIAVPVVGAVAALVVSFFTSGSMNSAYMYLMLGGETIILLLVNYGLLASSGEEVETSVVEEKPKQTQPKAKNKKNRKKK